MVKVNQMREEPPPVDPTTTKAILTEDGAEDHSQSGGKLYAALRITQQESLGDRVRALIQKELAEQAAAQGFESFQESDDFDIGDDYDPSTPYEEIFEGDVIKDMEERYKTQQAKVKTAKAAALVPLLKEMDPKELDEALRAVRPSPGSGSIPAPQGEPG